MVLLPTQWRGGVQEVAPVTVAVQLEVGPGLQIPPQHPRDAEENVCFGVGYYVYIYVYVYTHMYIYIYTYINIASGSCGTGSLLAGILVCFGFWGATFLCGLFAASKGKRYALGNPLTHTQRLASRVPHTFCGLSGIASRDLSKDHRVD